MLISTLNVMTDNSFTTEFQYERRGVNSRADTSREPPFQLNEMELSEQPIRGESADPVATYTANELLR